MLVALIRPIFNADSGEQARELVGAAITRLERPLPKVAALLERAEDDLLAFYVFPGDHRPKLRSTNPLERLNREIGRRTDVVGIISDDASLIRLATSLVIEQNGEWLVGRRYLSLSRACAYMRAREILADVTSSHSRGDEEATWYRFLGEDTTFWRPAEPRDVSSHLG